MFKPSACRSGEFAPADADWEICVQLDFGWQIVVVTGEAAAPSTFADAPLVNALGAAMKR